MSKQWEYLQGRGIHGGVEIGEGRNKKEYTLNELGKYGWELLPPSTGSYIFKREIEQNIHKDVPIQPKPVPEIDLEF